MSHSSRSDVTDHQELIRQHCLSLPEAEERETWGDPTFRVRDKIFAMIKYGDGRVPIWINGADGAQEFFVNANSDVFFVPPYVGHKGWIGIRLDVPFDRDEVFGLVNESYRLIAPKTLARQLPGVD